jgi:hypothetical protein
MIRNHINMWNKAVVDTPQDTRALSKQNWSWYFNCKGAFISKCKNHDTFLTATSPFIQGHHMFIMWQWINLSTSQLPFIYFHHLFIEDLSITVCHLLRLYSGGNKRIQIQIWRTGEMLLTRKTTALGATSVPVSLHLQFPREIKPSPLRWEVTT